MVQIGLIVLKLFAKRRSDVILEQTMRKRIHFMKASAKPHLSKTHVCLYRLCINTHPLKHQPEEVTCNKSETNVSI